MTIPKMRTIQAAFKMLKEADPQSDISQYYIRQLVLTDKIKYTMSGNRYLINMDSLVEYLSNPPIEEQIN